MQRVAKGLRNEGGEEGVAVDEHTHYWIWEKMKTLAENFIDYGVKIHNKRFVQRIFEILILGRENQMPNMGVAYLGEKSIQIS